MVSVLCTMENSNYNKIAGLDLWSKKRDAYNYVGSNPVIAHPPCSQHSRLKRFAKTDVLEFDLLEFTWNIVKENGGILEQPRVNAFWHKPEVKKYEQIVVWQSWFGFPCKKETRLIFVNCKPLQLPISFHAPTRKVSELHSSARSLQPLSFCQWLVDCVSVTV